MKFLILLLPICIALTSCQQSNDLNKIIDQLSEKVIELELAQKNSYTPGLGILMNAIQSHHLKLWKAGVNENWELADFELHELEERFEDIENFHSEHEEAKQLKMIYPQIEEVEEAVKEKNVIDFATSYEALTSTCNSCHQINDHPFIKIKVPNDGVGNQIFK